MKLLLGKNKLASQNLYACSIEFLTTQTELVLPSFNWTVHKVMEYLALGLLSKKVKVART